MSSDDFGISDDSDGIDIDLSDDDDFDIDFDDDDDDDSTSDSPPPPRITRRSSPLRYGIFDKKTGEPCSLKSLHYAVSVEDTFSQTVLTQHFRNDKVDHPAELIYRFAQNPRSTIHAISIELIDPVTQERKLLCAEIETKKKAKERYDDAISRGDSAMIAEQADVSDPGCICLSLGNVGPGWEVIVRIESVEENLVEFVEGDKVRLTVTIPSMNREGCKETVRFGFVENTRVEVAVQLTQGQIVSIGVRQQDEGENEEEEGREERGEPGKVTEKFETSLVEGGLSGSIRTAEGVEIAMNRDVVFVIEVAHLPLVSGLVEEAIMAPEDEEEKSSPPLTTTAVVSVLPVFTGKKTSSSSSSSSSSTPPPPPLCTEVIVVVDCSGSMSGNRIFFARDALVSFFQKIHKIPGKIYFNIVRFGTTHESLFADSSRLLNDETLSVARNYVVHQVHANLSGTRMLPPLTEILSRPVIHSSFSRQILFLTDGEDEQTNQVIHFVQGHCGTTRIFALGLGSGINPVLITRVAQVSNGRAVFITNGADIESAIVEQIHYAMQPALTGIQVKFFVGDGGDEELPEDLVENYLCAIPPCFNLTRYALYFRIREGNVPTHAEVSYSIPVDEEREETKRHRVVLRPVQEKQLRLKTLASRRRVLELGDGQNIMRAEQESVDNEIRELGMAGHFITSQTSFVLVVKNVEETIENEMVVDDIPAVQLKTKKRARQVDAGGDSDSDDFGGCDSDYDDEDGEMLLENTYYTGKQEDDDESLETFQAVIDMSEDDDSLHKWAFKARKCLIKRHFRLGQYPETLKEYDSLLNMGFLHETSRNDRERAINNVLSMMAGCTDSTFVSQMYGRTLPWLKKCKDEKMWFLTLLSQARYACRNKEWGLLKSLLHDLRAWCSFPSGKEDPRKSSQRLDIIVLEIQMYTASKEWKKVKELYLLARRIEVSEGAVVSNPTISGIIRESGGRIHILDKEWALAYRDFFEAFRSYDSAGGRNRILDLVYLTVVVMLQSSDGTNPINPFSSPEASPYKDHREISQFVRLLAAFENYDVVLFERIMKSTQDFFEADDFLASCVPDLFRSFRLRTLLFLMKPYNRIRLRFLARELQVDVGVAEDLCSRLILDGRLKGSIDQVEQLVCLYSENHERSSRSRYDALLSWNNALRDVQMAVFEKIELLV